MLDPRPSAVGCTANCVPQLLRIPEISFTQAEAVDRHLQSHAALTESSLIVAHTRVVWQRTTVRDHVPVSWPKVIDLWPSGWLTSDQLSTSSLYCYCVTGLYTSWTYCCITYLICYCDTSLARLVFLNTKMCSQEYDVCLCLLSRTLVLFSSSQLRFVGLVFLWSWRLESSRPASVLWITALKWVRLCSDYRLATEQEDILFYDGLTKGLHQVHVCIPDQDPWSNRRRLCGSCSPCLSHYVCLMTAKHMVQCTVVLKTIHTVEGEDSGSVSLGMSRFLAVWWELF